MRVILTNPPWTSFERKGVRAGSRWPHLKRDEEEDYMPYPFFLGYSSALLKKNGFDVLAIDAIAEDMDEPCFLKKVKKNKPDLFFAEVSIPSLKNDLDILKKIKDENNCKIAVAGPDVNIFNKEFMLQNSQIDYAFVGEYEYTLLDLVKRLKKKEKTDDIEGAIIRDKDKIYVNKRRELIKDLDSLPWPDREDLPLYGYHDNPGGIPRPCAQMIASRGCPFKCTFCVWPQLVYGGRNYRTRSIKDIVDEMEFLVKEKGFKSIYFDDDTFNIGKKRVLEFADELKNRAWNIPWAFMGRADLVDEEILMKLKEVGLSAVKYGLESANQELIDNAEKNLDLKKATENIILTKKLGIKVHLTFTFGLPGETRKTVNNTIRYVLDIEPESVQFSILTPFPGTKFHEDLEKRGMIISKNFNEYSGNMSSVIRTEELSPEDLISAQAAAYDAWTLNRVRKHRYATKSPIKLFFMCLREHSLAYTLKHTLEYVAKKRFSEHKR